MPNEMLSCATCGRSLEATAAWKGNGEHYYCNDFCAEAETVESPSLVPSLTEDVSARIGAMSSRAAAPPARRDRRPGDGLIDTRRSARAFFQAARRA
jgi:hypothetical protein